MDEPALVSVLAVPCRVEPADLTLVVWRQTLRGAVEELALIACITSPARITARMR